MIIHRLARALIFSGPAAPAAVLADPPERLPRVRAKLAAGGEVMVVAAAIGDQLPSGDFSVLSSTRPDPGHRDWCVHYA